MEKSKGAMETATSGKLTHSKLFVVSSEAEAKQALDEVTDRSIILALGLEAEFFVKKHLEGYKNPLYKFLDLKRVSYKSMLPHFKAAYSWSGDDEYLIHLRDRLGYYLTELDRSISFADKVLGYYKPKHVVLGQMNDYPGSSVINGSLKMDALYLVASERKIPLSIKSTKSASLALRSRIGSLLKKLMTTAKKRQYKQNYDLIVLAPGGHLLQLVTVIKNIKDRGMDVLGLTYNLTLAQRKQLDSSGIEYLEKESLVTAKINKIARQVHQKYIELDLGRTFKFKSRKVIEDFLSERIEHIIISEFREIAVDKILAKEFFDKIQARSLLTTTDPDSKAISFIQAAQSKHIKTMALQHGVMWSPAPFSVIPISNIFFTWSEISKQWIRKIYGFEKIKTVIACSPFHHSRDVVNLDKGVKLKKKLKLLYLVTIVILDSDVVALNMKQLFETLERSGQRVDVKVRIHPFQNTQNINALIKNTSLNVELDDNSSLDKSIGESDIVISEETTACFDAMLKAKPVIFFNPYTGEDYFEAKKRDYAMTILSRREIEDKLPTYLNESAKWPNYIQKGKSFAAKYLGIGSKSDKLSEIIASQIK